MAGVAGEHQGWTAYSILFAVVACALLFPFCLQIVVRFLFPLKPGEGVEPAMGSTVPRQRTMNTRYFTAIQQGVLLILPLVMLIPLVGFSASVSTVGLISTLGICASFGCALVYANRKGDLLWMNTWLQKGHDDGSEGEGR
jgi:NADH:ubiquinone oxidoreductase subunit 3 (subunit A)